jgi:chemotaxis protein methyltransferase CheR
MTTHLPPELLLQVSERIEAAVGLHFPPDRLRELDRKIRLAARELAFLDAEAFALWILSSPLAGDQIRMLAGHLLVRETYFFREPPVWGILQNTILPPLIASREGISQRLRLWSAACSTGEDAYSIAITVAQAALPHRQDWKCVILATDINPDALRRAQFGAYSRWSFRGTSPEVRSHYFRPMANGQFAIRPEIQRMVTFTVANLMSSAPIPNSGLMDVIFCRDALFYLTPERVKRVLERFYDTLVDGGWLIVGPEDTTSLTALPFVPVMTQGVIVYRKNVPTPRVSVLYPAPQSAAPDSPPTTHRTWAGPWSPRNSISSPRGQRPPYVGASTPGTFTVRCGFGTGRDANRTGSRPVCTRAIRTSRESSPSPGSRGEKYHLPLRN